MVTYPIVIGGGGGGTNLCSNIGVGVFFLDNGRYCNTSRLSCRY